MSNEHLLIITIKIAETKSDEHFSDSLHLHWIFECFEILNSSPGEVRRPMPEC